jgi:DNA-binding PadR family transcriptional regulator
MSRLTDRLSLAKIVLKEISQKPLSRTEIEQRTVRKAGTHATFEGIFRYLINDGYVAKLEQKHLSQYKITEKGAKLLEAIQ